MNKSSFSVWKSYPTWVHLGIIWSSCPADKAQLLIIFRFISVVQVLLSIMENIVCEHQSALCLLDNSTISLVMKAIPTHYSIILSTMTLYFFIVFIMTVTTVCKLNNERQNQSNDSSFLAVIITFHSEILFYLFNFCLSELFWNSNNNQFSATQKTIFFASIIIFLILNVLLTFYKIIFCYCRIKSNKFISRKGSKDLLGIAILKLLPLIKYLALEDRYMEKGIKYNIWGIVISLVISIILLIYTIIVLPEYNLFLNKVYIIFNSVFVGIAFSQLMEYLFEEHRIISRLSLLIIPFWIRLNLNIFNTIIKTLKYSPERLLSINYVVFLDVLYRGFESRLKQCDLKARQFSLSMLEAKWFDSFQIRGQSYSVDIESNNKIYLKLLMQRVLTLHPNNTLLTLAYAKLITKGFSLYPKAYSLCLQASRQTRSIPDKITVYYLISKIEKDLKNDAKKGHILSPFSKVIWQGFKYDNLLQDMKLQFCKYTEDAIDFWQILRNDSPNVQDLIEKAGIIEEKRKFLESTRTKYESEFSNESSLTLLYGIFKAQFMNMPWEGAQYIEKYNSFIRNRNSFYHDNIHFDEQEYGNITISGEKRNIGEVIYCSESLSKTFGRDQMSIVGQSVNILMPRFFQENHHQFLVNHCELGQNRVIGKENFLYGKDQSDNIFPISLLVGIYLDFEKGIRYIALIKKIKNHKQYILFKQDGLIEEVSADMRHILNVEPYKKINIKSLNLDFDFNSFSRSLKNDQINCNSKNQDSLSIKVAQNNKDQNVENGNLEQFFEFKVKIKRQLYNGQILNVMVLDPNGETLKLIQQTIYSKDIYLTSMQDFEILSSARSSDRVFRREDKKYQDPDSKNKRNNPMKEKTFNRNFNLVPLSRKILHTTEPENIETAKSLIVEKHVRDNPSLASPTKNRSLDNLQKMLSKPRPNRFKKIIINLFLIFLITFLIMVGVQYAFLRDSISDIRFAISALRTSYDRLFSLGLIWRYSNSYRARLFGNVAATEKDLDRYKTLLRTNGGIMKIANDALLSIIATEQERNLKSFFNKNITLLYDNNSTREVNSFEAINIFHERLTRFDATPHKILLQTGNLDLEFIRKNSMNDLLISSEDLVENVQSLFTKKIEEKKWLMNAIFLVNVLIGLFTLFLSIITFLANVQHSRKLSQVLLSIHPRNIDLTISKLNLFNNLLKKKESFSSEILQSFHLERGFSANNFKDFKLTRSGFQIKGVIITKVKQTFSIIMLIIVITVISSIRHISSIGLLEKALITNNQIIITSRIRHIFSLSFSTVVDLIGYANTLTMRNRSIHQQLLQNVDQIPLGNFVFETYTDNAGKFMDTTIQILFQGKSCSLLNDSNCLVVTQNGGNSILGVYSYFRDELYSVSKLLAEDSSQENLDQMRTFVAVSSSPKMNVINAAFVCTISFLSQKLDDQISNVLEDAKIKFSLQIILIVIFSISMMWFLMRKVFDDSMTQILLKMVPYEEVLKNTLLKKYIQQLYKERIETYA